MHSELLNLRINFKLINIRMHFGLLNLNMHFELLVLRNLSRLLNLKSHSRLINITTIQTFFNHIMCKSFPISLIWNIKSIFPTSKIMDPQHIYRLHNLKTSQTTQFRISMRKPQYANDINITHKV